ncbi:MAG: response regulator [Candidatus Microgenomates bacterium]|jgi:DNA-binding response OmpR family regulator
MKKVLFIEDDLLTNKAYADKFSKEYEILTALNGIDGVSSAIRMHPNLIILDIMLGGELNGFDVLRELKLNSESAKIPVIVLTNLEKQEESAKAAGAAACFIKANISLDTVGEEIKKYIS